MLEMLNAADPLLLYVVAGVIVLAIASLFGLVLFASREETFEDVVEKQRKAQEALLHSLQQGSGKAGKQNRKWNKLKNKKASKPKESEDHDQDSGVDDDEVSTETVTINTPPPMIAVEEPVPPPAATKKKKKKKNKNQQDVVDEIKPDIVEETIVVEEEVIVQLEPEVEATPELPSDDEVDARVELLDEEVEEVGVVEEPVVDVEDVIEEITELEAEVEPEPEPEPEPLAVPESVEEPVIAPVVEKAKSNKKKNKSSKQKAAPVLTTNGVEKLQADLKNCHLQADEVQLMMDVLLEKQSELEQWQKPNQKADPMEQMKRRIAEMEIQFSEERQSAQAIGAKLKESKVELQHERNARQIIQNEAQSRLNQQANEAEAMRKHLEEKHLSEMHSAQSQISRMQGIIDDGATNHMELQRLKEENAQHNHSLKNASMMAQQLADDKQSLMTELSQLKNTNRALRQEFDNLIIQHQQEMQNMQIAKVESEGALSQRLQEMNEQLMKVEAHNRNLQLEIAERLSEQARLNEQAKEVETFQMASKPDALEIEELKKQLTELTEKCKEYEMKAADVEVAGTDLADLRAKVAVKDQFILELQSKVSEMESLNKSSSGQQSPTDLVVVEPPLLSSESFEQIVADKDYEAEVEGKSEMVEDVIVPAESTQVESAPEVVQPEPEIVVVEVSSEECVPEDKQDATAELKAEIEKLTADYESAQATIVENSTTHEASIAQKQIEIDELQQRILDMQTAAMAAEPAVDENAINELQAKITQLEETLIAKDAELVKIKELEEALALKEDGPTKEELSEQLKGVKDELQGRTEATDELKLKNNELREKNWKVIDELAKAQKLNEETKKSTDIRIIKGLKSIVSDFSVPKFGDDYELLFKEFGEKVSAKTSEGSEALVKENEGLKEENTELKKNNELMNASQDEMLKSQQESGQLKEENAHIKNVLIETESMLCRLQTGVDAEVQKWQAKVTEKDVELEAANSSNEQLKQILSKHGYEHENLTALESSLTDGQKQLVAEKEENSKLQTKLKELDTTLSNTQNELDTKIKELAEAAMTTSNADEVTELQSKLKKTISERDLLIREYKNVKDNNTKMEAELKSTKETLEKVTASANDVVNGEGEKDAVIQNEL